MGQVDRLSGFVGNTAIKAPCDCATTVAIVLSGEQVVDGVQTAASRVLVKNQADATTNGIYFSDSGAWQRTQDFDGTKDVVQGTLVTVMAGTANANTCWRISTANPITIGTTALTFGKALFTDSSVASFIASGAGAIARTVQDRLRETISVGDFGADNTGVQSAVAAFQAAVNATPNNGLQIIHVPRGTYLGDMTGLAYGARTVLFDDDGCTYSTKPPTSTYAGWVQSSAAMIAAAGGSANALTATFTPTVTLLVNGMTFLVRAAATNTAAATFQADATAAKAIVKGANKALLAGDIMGAGHWLELTYDATLDKYVLGNPAVGIASSMVPIGTASVASAAALLSVTVPSGFGKVCFDFWCNPTTNGATISARISQGGSVKSDATYTGVFFENNSGSTAPTGGGGASATSFGVGASVINSSSAVCQGNITVIQAIGQNFMMMESAFLDTTTAFHQRTGRFWYSGSVAEIDALQLFPSAGNITGTIRAYGILTTP